LQFVPPFSNGMTASMVIGQKDFASYFPNQDPNFATSGLPPTAATLAFPMGAGFVNGNLVVGDSWNNRTLIFAPPFSTGMSASIVLGQASFSANSPNQGGSAPTASTQSTTPVGFSLVALAVFIALVGVWFAWSRRKRAGRA
jgi:hypothetical protein